MQSISEWIESPLGLSLLQNVGVDHEFVFSGLVNGLNLALDKLGSLNSLKIQWKHLTNKDAFNYNALFQRVKMLFCNVQRWSHGEKIMCTMCTIHEIHKQSTCHIYCLRVSDNFKLKTELIISAELNFVEIQFKLTLQTSTFCTEIKTPNFSECCKQNFPYQDMSS